MSCCVNSYKDLPSVQARILTSGGRRSFSLMFMTFHVNLLIYIVYWCFRSFRGAVNRPILPPLCAFGGIAPTNFPVRASSCVPFVLYLGLKLRFSPKILNFVFCTTHCDRPNLFACWSVFPLFHALHAASSPYARVLSFVL